MQQLTRADEFINEGFVIQKSASQVQPLFTVERIISTGNLLSERASSSKRAKRERKPFLSEQELLGLQRLISKPAETGEQIAA